MTEPQQLQLDLDFTDTFSPITDTTVKSVSLRLSVEQIKSGIISEMSASKQGGRNFIVLLAIAVHMDAENRAFPSISRLSEITGYSRPTVTAAIKELTEIEIGGQKVLQKKKVPSSNGHFKSVYKFTAHTEDTVDPIELVEVVEVTELPVEKLTSRDLLILFCELYEQTFEVAYVPNWGRDMQMIKSKLMGNFTDDMLKQIVTAAVTEYPSRWANKQYPLLTVGMLCSWVAQQAVAVIKQKESVEAEFTEKVEQVAKYTDYDSLGALDDL